MWGLLLASQREDQRYEVRLRVLRLVQANPELSTRKMAEDVGISNGSAFYVLAALVEKGFLKSNNFKNSSSKGRYAYVLTPKGLREKTLLTARFIERKREEYKNLRAEIDALEAEAGFRVDDGSLADPWTIKLRD